MALMSNKSYDRPLEHKQYIQLKYLTQNDGKLKDKKKIKKKKVVKNKTKKIRIFDDDIDLKNMDANGSEDELYFGTQEEKPIIAEVVDDRPLHMRRKDIDTNRWKTIDSIVEEVDNKSNERISDKNSKHFLPKSRKKANKRESDSNSDLSPVRFRDSKTIDSNVSSRRVDNRSDSDLSPERNGRTNDGIKRKRLDSDSDLSPERDSKEDIRRLSRYDSRDKKRHELRHRLLKTELTKSGSNSQRHGSDSDLSPVRSPKSSKRLNLSQKREQTLSGKRSGLSDAKHLREELMSTKKREQKLFDSVSAEMLGKNAKTVFRDSKSGRVRDLEEEDKRKQELDFIKEKIDSERKAKYKKWSKGLVQTEQQKEKLESDLHEMSKPLARYEGDVDLDRMLREKEREDDPMLATIRQNRAKQEVKEGVIKVMPKYNGPTAPANRFNISPGYRWDGVDRSNGFEKKLFDRISNKESNLEEAYKWSTQDM